MKDTQFILFAAAFAASLAHAESDTPPTPTAYNPAVATATASGTSTTIKTSSPFDYFSAPASPRPVAKRSRKKKSKEKRQSPEAASASVQQEITLPMARGELQAEVAAEVAQRERAESPRTQVGLSVSSWTPGILTTSSQLANTSNFETQGIPAFELNLFHPLNGSRHTNIEIGAGFLYVQRSGTIQTSNLSIPQTQGGYLTTLRAGLTYSPRMYFADRLVPYGELLLLPTLFITRSSAFDSGSNGFGLPISIGVGAFYKLNQTIAVDLGLAQVIGKVHNSSLTGFGVHGGVRIQI